MHDYQKQKKPGKPKAGYGLAERERERMCGWICEGFRLFFFLGGLLILLKTNTAAVREEDELQLWTLSLFLKRIFQTFVVELFKAQ